MRINLILLFVFLSSLSWAQRDKSVGFTCGRSSPSYTPVVINMEEYYKENQYDLIKSYLYKGKSEEQYLAILLIERSAEKQLTELSDDDRLQISKLKSSGKKVKACGGCAGNYVVPMKFLFTEEYKNEKEAEKYGFFKFWKEDAEFWADRIVAMNYYKAIQ